LFLRIKDVNGKRQVIFILAGIPIPESIKPCLSGNLIFAFDDFLLVPRLLVKLRVNLEN
jgi:hypothetical protein